MISPEEALTRLIRSAQAVAKNIISIRLQDALGLVLAKDVRSLDNLPRFTNSAMDGFAVNSSDCTKASSRFPIKLNIIGANFAGTHRSARMRKGCAIQIATGAPLPEGSNAVVMLEDCKIHEGCIYLTEPVPPLDNVRKVGEEIKRGEVALRKGTTLTPGEISWLATMGVKTVRVFRKPRIALLRTGNEVVDTHRSPAPFQVRDAHQISIGLALKKAGMEVSTSPIIRDDCAQVKRVLRKYLKQHDLILTTGGVSVGEKDLLKEEFRNAGFILHFEKISQRPGKPMVFGRKGNIFWIGLPGNPVSALVCSYLYVLPFIRALSGEKEPQTPWFEANSASGYPTNSHRTNFLRGRYQNGVVTFAGNQNSHCLGSFSQTNVLIKVPPSRTEGKKGHKVLCSLIP